jgi:hypothetical protein
VNLASARQAGRSARTDPETSVAFCSAKERGCRVWLKVKMACYSRPSSNASTSFAAVAGKKLGGRAHSVNSGTCLMTKCDLPPWLPKASHQVSQDSRRRARYRRGRNLAGRVEQRPLSGRDYCKRIGNDEVVGNAIPCPTTSVGRQSPALLVNGWSFSPAADAVLA